MSKEFLLKTRTSSLSYNTKQGAEIYRRSISVLLEWAVATLYPRVQLKIGQSLMGGYYYHVLPEKAVDRNFISRVTSLMRRMVSREVAFTQMRVPRKKAIRIFSQKNRPDKVKTLSYLKRKTVDLVFLDGYGDFVFGECVTSTKYLKTFRIIKYHSGIVVQFPSFGDIEKLPNPRREEKLFTTYQEAKEWDRILGIENAGDLNESVISGRIDEIIKVQEAFHEKKIGYMADTIRDGFPSRRLVFVSGPSSSGKTTFIKRLAIQIIANGLKPHLISLDDYFIDRDRCPKSSDGDYDFECLGALDFRLFNRHLKELLNRRTIMLPSYNFKRGKSEPSGNRMALGKDSVVLIEGIHALNPKLSGSIPGRKKFMIFASALTQLCIDDDNRIFTSDLRLIRRIVRDNFFRGHSALETIKRFPKVREGEDRNIFPYQDYADVFFNSSLIYEHAVLKTYVTKLLRRIKKTESEYFEARRLLNYLDFFVTVPAKQVPQVSILREFIGHSGFEY